MDRFPDASENSYGELPRSGFLVVAGCEMRIPVKWGTDSGEAGQGRSEATLAISMIGEVPHMSQESSEIGFNQHHFVSSFGLHRNVAFR
jgi:hypothetical protein